jgi:hypothetical protein
MDISYCPSQAVESAPYIVKQYVELAKLSCSYPNILSFERYPALHIPCPVVQSTSRQLKLPRERKNCYFN